KACKAVLEKPRDALNAPDPIAPLVGSLHELAPGVFNDPWRAWFADVRAYVTYLESVPPENLGWFAPPESAIARKPKTSPSVMPDALAEQGFTAYDIKSRYRFKRRGAFGRVDAAP